MSTWSEPLRYASFLKCLVLIVVVCVGTAMGRFSQSFKIFIVFMLAAVLSSNRLLCKEALLSVLVLLWGFVSVAVADEASPSTVQFDIRTIQVDGNSVLAASDLRPILFKYIGGGREFSDLQRLVREVEGKYRQKGYPTVKVVLPPQNLNAGHITLDVIEFELGFIEVEDGQYFDSRNLRNSVPQLKSGIIPNNDELARALERANKHPAKRLQVVFKPSKDARRIDAEFFLEERAPYDLKVEYNNEGTNFSGENQLSLGGRYTNLFGLDHTLGLQVYSSPLDEEDFLAGLLTYSVPLYRFGGDLTFYGYHSEVTDIEFADSFLVGGAGASYGVRYGQDFAANSDWKHRYHLGLAYKLYRSQVAFNGSVVNEVPELNSAIASLGYRVLYRPKNALWYTQLGVTAEVDTGLGGSEDVDFAQAREGATANFSVFSFNAVVSTEVWADWRARMKFNGQYSDQPLIPTEQFGVGGRGSLRGLAARELVDDRGLTASLEWFTPNYGRRWFGENYEFRFLLFSDVAYLEQVDVAGSETASRELFSYGVGTRFRITDQFELALDYAWLDSSSLDELNRDDAESGKLHIGFQWNWQP